jgi:hypothetical protein
MDGRTIAFIGCAAIAWSAAFYKAAALRHDPRNLRLWSLAATIALPSAGFTMAITPVYTAIGRLTGVPNLATLLVYASIVGYSISALIMLLLWESPTREALRRAKKLILLYAVILAVLVVLFFAIDAPVSHPIDFDDVYGPGHVGGTFLLVYVSAFACGLIAEARHGRHLADRVAETGGRPWLRRGLRLMIVGSVIALGYCLGKAALVIGAWLGTDLHVLGDLGILFACLGSLVMTAGFTMPSWGPRLSAVHGKGLRARTFLRLRPLWALLFAAFPQIALDPRAARRTELRKLADLDFNLNRRLVEISDGLLALSPYLDGPPAGSPAQLAVRIRQATHRFGADGPGAGSAVVTAAGPVDDLDWLVQVSTALRHLPAGQEG